VSYAENNPSGLKLLNLASFYFSDTSLSTNFLEYPPLSISLLPISSSSPYTA